MIPKTLGQVVVVCEGDSDYSVIRNLVACRALGDISVAYPEKPLPGGRTGFAGLLKALRLHRDFPKVESLVIVSDADLLPLDSLEQVRQQIQNAGEYAVPTACKQWARSHEMPRVSIVLLPDSNEVGDLETVCLRAARDKWPNILACVDALAQCTGASVWAATKRSKMLLRATLTSVCETDPNTSLVYLWSRGEKYEIPLEHAAFDDLASFLANALQT